MRFLRAHTEIYSQMASGRPLISNPAPWCKVRLTGIITFYHSIHHGARSGLLYYNLLSQHPPQGLKLRKYFRGQVGPHQINLVAAVIVGYNKVSLILHHGGCCDRRLYNTVRLTLYHGGCCDRRL
jgi:hypothetical protein